MANIRYSKFVSGELLEIATVIADDHPDAAERFLDAADHTFELLAEQPHMGRARKFPSGSMKDLRSFRVNGFDNYLIFYRPVSGGIEVLHVYHGARDLDALFD